MNMGLSAALELLAKGYTPIAMKRGSKVPAERWTHWLDKTPTVASVQERWRDTDHGVALLCKGLIVVDVR